MSKKEISQGNHIVPDEVLINQIYLIRGQKVMLDKDLAVLYAIETRALKQAVRRNIDRFPADFMFELTDGELRDMVSQFVIPNKSVFGGAKPFAFTEQGVAMLSSVLTSKQAIQVNINIMRIFTKVRQMLSNHTEVKLEISEIRLAIQALVKKQEGHDKNIDLLFSYIDRLQEEVESPQTSVMERIGYKIGKSKV